MFRRAVTNFIRFSRPSISSHVHHACKNVLYRPGVPVTRFSSKTLENHSERSYSTLVNKWTDDEFKNVLGDDKIVVFMKGTPEAPQCGFSKYVIQILYMHGCEDFKTFNVLTDEELRNRVKEFSNWPTIPQIYLNGEFIGGFDILLQLHQNGELIEELEKIGHRSALIDTDQTEGP